MVSFDVLGFVEAEAGLFFCFFWIWSGILMSMRGGIFCGVLLERGGCLYESGTLLPWIKRKLTLLVVSVASGGGVHVGGVVLRSLGLLAF